MSRLGKVLTWEMRGLHNVYGKSSTTAAATRKYQVVLCMQGKYSSVQQGDVLYALQTSINASQTAHSVRPITPLPRHWSPRHTPRSGPQPRRLRARRNPRGYCEERQYLSLVCIRTGRPRGIHWRARVMRWRAWTSTSSVPPFSISCGGLPAIQFKSLDQSETHCTAAKPQ